MKIQIVKNNKKRTQNKSSKKHSKQNPLHRIKIKKQEEFPNEFPFWARFKKNKNRTTLIIDEETKLNTTTNKKEELFVHREATHTAKGNEYEKIFPNPDKTDPRPMYLKRPKKKPKNWFRPHNKKLNIPQLLIERYDKNNKK